MPLIMGLMPVLPEARYDGGRFERATLDPPLGSGPYRVTSVSPGRSIVYKRVPGYWGRDLPVNRGLYNFDTIRIDYYRDDDSSFEAFKAGLYDLRVESDPARWARGYDFPDARRGLVIRKALPHGRPSGLFGFVLNTRRPLFRNIRVREALDLAFDFEWVNRSLFFGAYRRISSSFDNSELAAHGPPTPAEARLLAPWQSRIPDAIWRQGYVPLVAQDERNRRNLERAQALLKAAGYEIRGGRLVDARSGRPFAFEILLANPNYERLALVYARMLKRLGIQVSVRTVDPTQYEARREQFDFDVIVNTWGNSLSPGNEQAFYWGSAAADELGSRNYPGVRDPAIDAMIAALIQARTREDLVAAARALDRLLMAGRYVVPLYYSPEDWLAWRSPLRIPDRLPLYGYSVETWWRAHGR
jgi:ABC-type oligopeptide transport system substrate-binding subunit